MSPDQITIFGILAATLFAFALNRWRFDVVALLALFACVATGLVPPAEAFDGFAHPAVITVVAVLALSRALSNSGFVSVLAERVARLLKTPASQVAGLCAIGAAVSGFMNNVGALALLMPVALSTAYRFGYPAGRILMPLSFSCILGGLTTLIGTPPNIIVANAMDASPFTMFDFTPVGLPLAVAGTVFVVTIGWRLIPHRGDGGKGRVFEVSDYITEVQLGDEAEAVDGTVADFEASVEGELRVLRLLRNDQRVGRPEAKRLRPGDVLVIQAATSTLEALLDKNGVGLVPDERLREDLGEADLLLREVVVSPRSPLEHATAGERRLRSHHGVNVLALAREGRPTTERLARMRLHAGDVLLVQGAEHSLEAALHSLRLLPLATGTVRLRPPRLVLPLAVFATAVGLAAADLVPMPLALLGAVVAMVLAGVLPTDDAYAAVDWPVVVLLGAMIPVGHALETAGGTTLIAEAIHGLAGAASPYAVVALLLAVTMTLSDIMNNAATSVLMAPIALALGDSLGLAAEPFLMAVAVGASCAFLTPIGHQNNTLVLGPGGYRFSDYWRMGLPLELIVIALGTALIPLVWPF